MNKAAPSLPRILVMVVFALSCFGLLLFLWLSFGGPVPLKPKGYRVQVDFPEATTLATEADVRVAGVPVGKVRKVEVGDGTNRTVATVELERRFAPLRTDARAVLRQKTLLGETYVELTPGRSEKTIPEGGELPDGQVKRRPSQLDEIFDSLDPATRAAFKRLADRSWPRASRAAGATSTTRSARCPASPPTAPTCSRCSTPRRRAVQRLVKNTGVVFGALTENEAQLQQPDHGLQGARSTRRRPRTTRWPRRSGSSRRSSTSPSSRSRACRSSRRDTDPLITDLRPVARDLQPTLRDVRALAPDLERFFEQPRPGDHGVQDRPAGHARGARGRASRCSASSARSCGRSTRSSSTSRPSQWQVADFLNFGAAALAAKTESPGGGTGHYLRQFGPLGAESVAIWQERAPNNRGNSYFQPLSLAASKADAGQAYNKFKITGQFDCRELGREARADRRPPGCVVQNQNPFDPATSSRSTASSSRAPSRTSRPTTTRRGAAASGDERSSAADGSGRGGGAARAGAARSRRARRRRAAGGR